MNKALSLALGLVYCIVVGYVIIFIIIAGGQFLADYDTSSDVARLIQLGIGLYLGYMTIYIPYWFDLNYKKRETKPTEKPWYKIIEERFKI